MAILIIRMERLHFHAHFWPQLSPEVVEWVPPAPEAEYGTEITPLSHQEAQEQRGGLSPPGSAGGSQPAQQELQEQRMENIETL